MVQVRNNIFETNSSSTHSVGISTKYDYDHWACDADDLKLDNTLLDTLGKHLSRFRRFMTVSAEMGGVLILRNLRRSLFPMTNFQIMYMTTVTTKRSI